mmetsp:Transcript_21901/g.45834  ORF Transcript_21901/g.45834 Transcript_21901/m.45834 type:complete len:300 (+) Transcript_21901:659-1558(+)
MFRRWLSWWWKFKLETLKTRKLFSFHRLISFRISESLVLSQSLQFKYFAAKIWPQSVSAFPLPSLTSIMFRNTFQSGFLSILYSIGSKPLQIWDSRVQNGHIKRITDQDIQSSVLEIMGTNVSTSFIMCPADPKQTLGIKLPFLVMILKNVNKYFTFEVQVLDDKGVKRRFRASSYQLTTKVHEFICTMPMRLDEGWNQVQFNLSDFTRRAYGTNYVETLRVQIHANCRIRRVYFSDRLYSEEELPPEFKLLIPNGAGPGAPDIDCIINDGEPHDRDMGQHSDSVSGVPPQQEAEASLP